MPTYQRHPDSLHAQVGPDFIVMSTQTLAYFGFNEVAQRIWELLGDGPISDADLCQELVGEYQVDPQRCHATVSTFLSRAAAEGFVEVIQTA